MNSFVLHFQSKKRNLMITTTTTRTTSTTTTTKTTTTKNSIGMISLDVDNTLFPYQLVGMEADLSLIHTINNHHHHHHPTTTTTTTTTFCEKLTLEQYYQLCQKISTKYYRRNHMQVTSTKVRKEAIGFELVRRLRSKSSSLSSFPSIINFSFQQNNNTNTNYNNQENRFFLDSSNVNNILYHHPSKSTNPNIPNNMDWNTDSSIIRSKLDDINSQIENLNNHWVSVRDAAADHLLYDGVVETLQTLRSFEMNNNNNDVCISAITNGTTNPLQMKGTNNIGKYFDFCVSGEDDIIFPFYKPHRRIFDYALDLYRAKFPHHHYPYFNAYEENNNNNNNNNNKNNNNNNNNNNDRTRYDTWNNKNDIHDKNDNFRSTSTTSNRIWVHVGDDLVKDVGGSVAAGAYAVWYNPEEQSNTDTTVTLPTNVIRIRQFRDLPIAIDSLLSRLNNTKN